MRRLGLPLFALWLQVAVPSVPLPHVEQYEVVWPQRLPRPRARRALPSHLDRYPESVSYVLGAQGHNFTLHLRKNRELVGSGYTETYSTANGSQVAEQPQRQDHCFYQGHVEGHEHSAASLSTCAGLSVKFPRMFSQCSRADLELFVEKPRTGCLDNAPDPGRLVGDPVCGNWFVERGEQCDCGPPQDCRNPCCNATTCRLAHGAECAQGACCRECRVTPAGELCRHPKDACDLEEHCDGQQPGCPEDAFQENGTPCPGGYCYNGACPTLAQRCQDLWGPGSRAAMETCYTYSISPDCRGRIPLGSSRVNRCGVLYCEGGQKPPEQSSCTLTSSSAACQALVLEEGVGYEPVPEGTRCGEERICWKGRCEHLQVYRSRNCSAQCNNHGVCNHKDECQCHPGWAPPHCTELLPSVHTATTVRVASHSTTPSRAWPDLAHVTVGPGPATTKPSNSSSESLECCWSRSLLMVVLVPAVLLVALALLAGAVIYRKASGRNLWGTAAPKTAIGLSNPLFHEGRGVPAKGGAPGPPHHPSQPARPAVPRATPKQPPPAPPAATSKPPPTVPVYTWPPPDQLRPAPPAKPLPELKPKQVVKPIFPPPMPPVKPGAGGAHPGPPPQSVVGPKTALKPPVQRR
ncbi:disintegrin and metalloproteinase domain-containing protein 8 [Puma concolor]|uniref:Disintegrin and metalloproteinase domain-containing protein 8 n=1 Tax=Puma concolor TaxID=9696 RepID=A0A6P6HEX8_PUMCO|nr:disintegrin and metalloproteinase domain-containing protein 8 [Puma concolor]